MVTYRQPPRAGAVATSAEWQAMGAAGELLRQLCELLLNAQPSQLVPNEKVRATLTEVLKAKPPAKPGMSMGAKVGLAAALLLAAGGGVYFMLPKPPPPAIVYTDPRAAWAAGNIDELRTRLDAVKPRIKEDETESLDESTRLVGDLGALKESFERFRNRAAPASQEDVALYTTEIGQRDQQFAALQARVVKLEDDHPARQADRTKEPRGSKPERWLVTRMGGLGRDVAAIDRLLTTEPDKRAEFKQLQDQYEALEKLVGETRQKPWPTDPAAQEALANTVETATDDVDALAKKLKDMRVAARDALNDFIKTASDRGQSLRSAQLQERFRAAVKAVKEDVETSETRGWKDVTEQIGKADELFRSIDGAFNATLNLEAPPQGSGVAYTGADKHLEDLRERLIASIPETTDPEAPGLRDKVQDAAGRYNAAVADLRAMYTSAITAEGMLAQGLGLDEAEGEASIAMLDGRVRGAQAYEPLKAGVAPVLARVDALKLVKGMKDAPALIAVIRDQASGLSAVLTAWRALPGTGFPANVSDLTSAPPLTERVLAVINQKLGAANPRTGKLTEDVRGQLRAFWRGFFDRPNLSVADVNAAFELAPSIPGGEQAVKEGPSWLRFNHERWTMAKAIEKVAEVEAKQQIELLHPVVKAFDDTARTLGLGQQPEVSQFSKDLNPFLIKKIVTLDEMGPARAKWTFEEDKGRGVARYRFTGKRGEHVLEFRPLVMGEDQITYLCTTEMSVGTFIDIVDSFGKWEELRGGPGQPRKLVDTQGLDTRAGVRTIRWTGGADRLRLDRNANEACPNGFTKNGLGWHSNPQPLAMCRNPYFPEGSGPGRGPDDLDPVDWVSPAASMYVARLVGCRLPSSGEWLAAAKVGANPNPNLRDATYDAQYKYVAENIAAFQAVNVMDYPAANVLRLQDQPSVPPEQDSGVVQGNDNTLYFSKVNEPSNINAAGGPNFHHLIGNVWEYTFEQPLLAEALDKTTPDVITGLIGVAYEHVRVIGGSALSNPEWKTSEPLKPKRTEAPRGWSDVGFRLAFSTGAGAGGSGSPKQRLLSILQRTPYLSKPDRS
jgi:hypothetical protein